MRGNAAPSASLQARDFRGDGTVASVNPGLTTISSVMHRSSPLLSSSERLHGKGMTGLRSKLAEDAVLALEIATMIQQHAEAGLRNAPALARSWSSSASQTEPGAARAGASHARSGVDTALEQMYTMRGHACRGVERARPSARIDRRPSIGDLARVRPPPSGRQQKAAQPCNAWRGSRRRSARSITPRRLSPTR
jgi:hypothetical protein